MADHQIQTLWQEVRDLSLGSPPRIEHLPIPPSPVQFLRHYVSPNKPCLISNAVSHWPALTLWPTPNYLRQTLAATPVSCHLTPTGKADAITSDNLFASAHVETMPFPEALDMVSMSGDRGSGVVAYLQQQNDCFREEYGEVLGGDCDGEVAWASEAMGGGPEAVNLWVGSGVSETSFHKDHYENLYVVVSGEKRFLLLPPTDVHRMYVREYLAARYRYHKDSGEFSLELEEPTRYVPWCSVDPYPSPEEKQREAEKFPLYFNGTKPYEVTVKAGQMLYLPSMWFHHVTQSQDDSELTIAINYWYDMQFDIKYAYFNFLQSIPYPPSKDQKLSELRNTKSRSWRPFRNPGDESDANVYLENWNLGEGSDDEAS